MKKILHFIVLVIFAPLSFAQPGNLDTTFDGDGKKVISFAVPNDYGEFVLIQPDSKILVGGRSSLTGGNLSFSLARMNANGSFDSTFGTGGKVTTSYGTEGFEAISGALQTDGKIVVAGNAMTNASLGYSQIAVVRYLSNGALDTTFDTDGMVFTQVPTSNEDFVKKVLIQPDGKILVGVQTKINFNWDFVLIRYNSDGSLDNTFDSDGIVRTIQSGNEAIYDLALQNDGKIVAVGYKSVANDDLFAARYNPDGSIDTSFATNGFFTYDFAANHNYIFGVALTSTNKIVLAGRYQNGAGSSPFVARLTSDGTFDTTFDTDGILIQTTDEALSDVVLQADDKIIAAGTSNGKFGVWKLNTNGTFDTTFGTSGKVETTVNINFCIANNTALQPDGKIVVVGSTYGSPFTKYGVVRYQNDAPLSAQEFAGNAFTVYPNPSSGHFDILTDGDWIGAKARVYNLLGQKTTEFTLETQAVSLDLDKGIYLFTIDNGSRSFSKKIIIK